MASPAAIEESMLQEVELEALAVPEECTTRGPRTGRGLVATKVVAAAALLVTLIANVQHLPRERVGKLTEFEPRGITMLNADDDKDEDAKEDLCKDEPQLIMNKVLHNNLGKQGPGTGKEGMVLEGTYKGPDGDSQDVELHINQAENSEPFKVEWTQWMGLQGKFMSINTKAGTEVTIEMKVTKPGETDPLTLPVLDMSFFDLDKHKEGNAEYVKVKDYYSVMEYQNTEITMEDTGHWTKFQATEEGTGSDNPKDPLKLTEQQLKRAFTVEFLDFTTGKFTLGNEGPTDTHGRRFDFIGKPALKCAMGVDHNKVEMHVKANPQCCILKIMSFGLVCVPHEEKQFYHFMCDPVEAEDK